jgi:hypothetical protein
MTSCVGAVLVVQIPTLASACVNPDALMLSGTAPVVLGSDRGFSMSFLSRLLL